MRTIGVVTVGRSDYGILRPILRRIAADEELELRVFVAGAHLAQEHGLTVQDVESDAFPIAARIELLAGSDDPLDTAFAIGRGVGGFAGAFDAEQPEIVLVLGDRFEMLAAAVAALPLRIPLAHVHGGESSEGAFDESIRHALTKLSHLHFASTEDHARRIRQLGEEAWRVTVSGAPGLDEIRELEPLPDADLEQRIGLPLDGETLIVTYHPATLDEAEPAVRVRETLAAVEASGRPAVFTLPNADPGAAGIRELVEEYAAGHARTRVFASLGAPAYFSLLRRAAAMVGNSSSGIVEAASFRLPVVNVGIRQEGRLRAKNVIDVPDDRDAILAGIERATSAEFRAGLAGLENPYGDGHAADRIVEVLKRAEPGPRLVRKRFEHARA